MKKKKTFSRRDALKRMSKTALAIASVTETELTKMNKNLSRKGSR